jgi:hypothetical protein
MSRSSRMWRGAIVVAAMAWMLVSPAATVPGEAQAGWPFHLEWTHNGPIASYYRLCVNGACSVLGARVKQGDDWIAPLPLLPPGEYRLVLEACGNETCRPGTPDLMIRVTPPGPRRPPIDVVNGPRIPASR